jgi:hypothetical protein
MIEALFLGAIKLLGSAGFGTIFGGVMGLLNRREDARLKKMDHDHELAMRDKDAAIMAQEWAARTKVAEIEGEAKAEEAGYAAMAKSYEFGKPSPGGKMEAFSAFMRPFMSGGYFIFSTVGCGWILYYALAVVKVEFTPAQWFEITMFVMAWFFFMAGASIGWWYAMRPGKRPPTLSLR